VADNLVVVESPAKAKTINKYLGKNYVVKASMGHVKDLPKSKLGVDVEHGFEPTYVAVKTRGKVLKELKALAKKAKHVFLATDPDREGEAIGWHLAKELKGKDNDVVRVRFREITKAAILKAMQEPSQLEMGLVNAQQARRILDRLVGYSLSPLLWKSIRRGLSAGRVQSIAVRLVCEREDAVTAFVPEEYWDLTVDLKAAAGKFSAQLFSLGGKKVEKMQGPEAQALAAELPRLAYTVSALTKKEQRRFPAPPFTTSTLQQDAARKLRFTSKRTMAVAQQLYEGLDIGPEGTQGLITYMRTDSVRVSHEAQMEARQLIAHRYGEASVPEKPPYYRAKRPGQDAHEAVRPTSALREPELIAGYLTPDQNKLYGLIWKRFIASQMAPALFDAASADILAPRKAGDAVFRATGSVLRFAGFLAAYNIEVKKHKDDDEDEKAEKAEREEKHLPDLKEGEALKYLDGRPEQHFTQPPPRFSDATLVKALEELGIGRPSTYAPTISTILDRLYVERIEGARLKPTELGQLINKLLVEHFPGVLNVDFTAHMEEKLDQVEEGALDWREAIGGFYTPFVAELDAAKRLVKSVRKEIETATTVPCDKCGTLMTVKWGRNGKFLACPNYPDCKNTRPLEIAADGTFKAGAVATTDEVCPKCGKPMAVKTGRFGRFLACTGYPECKSTKPMAETAGIACPKCEKGHVISRRSKRGKAFYGCDQYPKCDFVAWDKPVDKPCPSCGAKYLVEKTTKAAGTVLKCATEGCDFKMAVNEVTA
jgi:DNA topoisomerase-1